MIKDESTCVFGVELGSSHRCTALSHMYCKDQNYECPFWKNSNDYYLDENLYPHRNCKKLEHN